MDGSTCRADYTTARPHRKGLTMGTGEKVESSVYMLFIGILILGLLFVGISMGGMMLTGSCDVGAVDANGHSACYNQAFDNLDSVLGQGPNPKW